MSGVRDAWLVAIDLQTVFADPQSPWAATPFERALEAMALYAPLITLTTVDEVLGSG